MSDGNMKLRSEDPVPYRCGQVRAPDMDTFTRTIKYDGSLDAVFTHRTQLDTIAGTVWRFILDENKTLVAVPYQSPHAPAKAAHCVPQRIESILGGPVGLGNFAFAVAHAAKVNVNCVARPWESEIHEATAAELQKWKKGRKWPALDRYDKDRTEANRERCEKWKAAGLTEDANGDRPPDQLLAERKAITREVCARYNLPYEDEAGKHVEPDRMKAVEKEQVKLATRQARIEAKHRKRVEGEKAKWAAEIEAKALAELGLALSAHGARPPGKAKLKELFHFIRHDICLGNPIIRDADLRRVLEKAERLTGTNITESVFLDYSPGMKAHVEELAKETAEAEKIGEAEARRRVLDRVRFVAVFEDGRSCLVESIVCCVHDETDAERFQRVAPSNEAREKIKENTQNETRTIGLNEIRNASGQLLFRALTPDFAEVECFGKKYKCPPKGRRVVAEFVMSYERNRVTRLTGDHVLRKIGYGESLSDALKDYETTWKALFRRVQGTKDVYEFTPALAATAGEISGKSPP